MESSLCHIPWCSHRLQAYLQYTWGCNLEANTTHSFLARNIGWCSRNVRQIAYTAYIRPIVDYASPACDLYTKRNNQIDIDQVLWACYVTSNFVRTKCVDFLSAISSGELMTLNKHSLWGYSRLVLISLLSPTKQCGLSVLLKDTTYGYSWGSSSWSLDTETDILTTWQICSTSNGSLLKSIIQMKKMVPKLSHYTATYLYCNILMLQHILHSLVNIHLPKCNAVQYVRAVNYFSHLARTMSKHHPFPIQKVETGTSLHLTQLMEHPWCLHQEVEGH